LTIYQGLFLEVSQLAPAARGLKGQKPILLTMARVQFPTMTMWQAEAATQNREQRDWKCREVLPQPES
jgi:hypothetical protein